MNYCPALWHTENNSPCRKAIIKHLTNREEKRERGVGWERDRDKTETESERKKERKQEKRQKSRIRKDTRKEKKKRERRE